MAQKYSSQNRTDEKLKKIMGILAVVLVLLVILASILVIRQVKKFDKDNAYTGELAQNQKLKTSVLLCVDDTENEWVSTQFLLVDFDSDKGKVSVCEIPASQKVTYEDATKTLQNAYDFGGASYVRDALQEHFSISVQKYIDCPLSQVEIFINYFDGMDFVIPKAMQETGENGNLTTNLVKGAQRLNGNQFCQYWRYNLWDSPEQKAQKRVSLLTKFLNDKLSEFESETIVDVYADVSGKLTTDISIVQMNDFSLLFKSFLTLDNPFVSLQIDFSDGANAKKTLQSYF